MDDTQKLIPEPVEPQALTEGAGGIKEGGNPNNAGRKSIDENVALQIEYFQLYNLHVLGGLTTLQVARAKEMSLSKVERACAWVRRNWKILEQKEYWVDAENTVNERIRELNILLDGAKTGDVVLNIRKEPVVVNGEVVRRVNKLYLTNLLKQRKEYEDTRNEIRGIISRHGMVVAKTAILGDVTINTQNKIEFINSMAPEDRDAMWKLIEKYAKPPES